MAGCVLLCFLDCYSGYHQIVLKEEDQIKTAFITPFGTYAYKTMSFGLKNAGATYQRAIQMCFTDQPHRNVETYVDDVVIKTRKRRSVAYAGFGGSSTQLNVFSEYHQGNCSGSSSATGELKPIL
jgi:hypothetical protein